jgi:uncharacterized membrane protein
MVIMALDHTRDYFHAAAYAFDPADPTQTTLPIFFTRWITHFCAPSFSFLAGISAFMASQRRTRGELSVFLVKRGLWLVFIELTVVGFAWFFDCSIQDLWIIGDLGTGNQYDRFGGVGSSSQEPHPGIFPAPDLLPPCFG